MPDTITVPTPEVGSITRHAGSAGQFSYSTVVTYPGEASQRVTFVASTFGGPIIMATPTFQIPVSADVIDRIGSTLDADWVRAFFAR